MMRPALVPIACSLTLLLAACSGGFPGSAAGYRYQAKLAAQPKGSYLRTLSSSVQSRVASIQPESFAWQELKRFRAAFEKLDAIAESQALLAALQAEKLVAVIVRIRQALASAKGERPVKVDAELEAGAIKAGLIGAYYQLATSE